MSSGSRYATMYAKWCGHRPAVGKTAVVTRGAVAIAGASMRRLIASVKRLFAAGAEALPSGAGRAPTAGGAAAGTAVTPLRDWIHMSIFASVRTRAPTQAQGGTPSPGSAADV